MNSRQNHPVVNGAVHPAAAPKAAATPTNEPTTTFTEAQLSERVAADFYALTNAGWRRA
jgi:hypothetical protein